MLRVKSICSLGFGLTFLAGVISSCDTKNNDNDQSTETTSTSQAIQESQGVINKSTPYPMVTDCELNKVTTLFDQHVSRSSTGLPPLTRPTFKFSLKSLRERIEAQIRSNVPSPLMLVHYGLDENGSLTYGIGFTNATGINDKFEVPNTFFVLNDRRELEEYIGVIPWREAFGKKYTSGTDVFIKRSASGGFESYDSTMHNRFVVFRTAKVLDFIEDNTPAATGTSLVADSIEIASYAHLKNKDEYHHGIALVPWSGTIRMVDNIPTRDRFAMRALDLGSPCPQNCDLFQEKYMGQQVPGCPERIMLK